MCLSYRPSSLVLRAVVELAARGHLHDDGRSADAARLAGAVVDPVPVFAAGECRGVLRLAKAVHGHHLAGLDADLQELRPVLPERAHRLLRHLLAGCVRVEASAEQQLGAIDVADAADHRLVHEQQADRRRGLAHGGDEPLLALLGRVDQRIRAELVDGRLHLVGRQHLARGRAAEVGDRVVGQQAHAHRADRLGREASRRRGAAVSCSDIRSRATRGAPMLDERVLAARVQHGAALIRLAHAAVRGCRGRVRR